METTFRKDNQTGYYYIYFPGKNGKRQRRSLKTKIYREALKKFRDFEPADKIKTFPLNDYWEEFLGNLDRKEKTIKAYECTFKQFLKVFDNHTLDNISRKDIFFYLRDRQYYSSLYQARKDLIHLKAFFNYALLHGDIKENPCKGIKQKKLPEKLPPFLTPKEYEALTNTIIDKDLLDITIFAVNTGLRQMELIELKQNQIFTDHIILTNWDSRTKNDRVRGVPLDKKAVQVLRGRKKTEYVFTLWGRKINQYTLSKKFNEAVKLSGINPKINFHSLRHTFASWLVQKGVSLYEVSKLLGHSSVKVTEIYAHLLPENLAGAVKVLDS